MDKKPRRARGPPAASIHAKELIWNWIWRHFDNFVGWHRYSTTYLPKERSAIQTRLFSWRTSQSYARACSTRITAGILKKLRRLDSTHSSHNRTLPEGAQIAQIDPRFIAAHLSSRSKFAKLFICSCRQKVPRSRG
jgi:hypothetical protein